jgi:phosphatidylglycerol:prolipoprotein diacylglycerol transferase
MHPVLFELFGIKIGTYGLFIIAGAVAAWFLVRLLAGNKNKDVPLVFLICICGGFIGAFMLRPIMKIHEVFIHWESFRQMPVGMLINFLFGEIVFYGGLIGGATAMVIFCRGFKIPILPIADIFAPALALAHSFGRVGCFFGGCCYGIETHSSIFTAILPASLTGAPTGVPLLAIQLIEALCLFVIAVILVVIYIVLNKRNGKVTEIRRSSNEGITVCLYGALYTTLRFILEFYRGDERRGIYGVLSTSQYISIVLFLFSVVLFYIIMRKRKRLILMNTH